MIFLDVPKCLPGLRFILLNLKLTSMSSVKQTRPMTRAKNMCSPLGGNGKTKALTRVSYVQIKRMVDVLYNTVLPHPKSLT